MKQEHTMTHKLEELLYKKIMTADGKRIGHVFDIQISRDGAFRIMALMYGEKSLLFRLHAYEPFARAFRFNQKPRTIPWDEIDHFDHTAVYLKPGYKPRKDK